ncbi:hypothetical protein [Enterococcus sp. LJL90]
MFDLIVQQHFQQDPWERGIHTNTGELKAVSDYSGVPLSHLLDLPYSQFKLYQRDSWVANMRSTEEGRKFLETCWRLCQGDADEQAVKQYQAYGGGI